MVNDGPTLLICLFGGLRLSASGHAVKFSAPPKAASLLAYLIVHRAQQTSRDAVAFALWPEEHEARARANLRRHIALLVRTLPAGAALQPVVSDNRSIRWNPLYPCALDVAEFERLSASPHDEAGATALYVGDLLPAIYDEWIIPERERLRSIHGANLERLTDRYARAGDYASAIATTRALLQHDPWREDALRTLLSLRDASGDRAGALQEYEYFAERLRRDLDVEPMPETISRYESILRGRDPAKARPGSALERSTAPATMPFVGRGEELQRLRQMWVRAMRGLGGVAVVSGEAGIGKSRLIAEFGATVVAQGGTVVAGAATFPEAMPYQAVIQALRSALPSLAGLPLDPAWLAAAADILPELRDRDAALPRLSALEPDRQKDRLFEAVWHCFETLAHERPVLLVFEDVHWAGPATIDLLINLARRTPSHPLLVVVTCRDDEKDVARPLSALRHALRRGGSLATLPLGGFTTDEVAFIVGAVLAGRYEGADFANRAHALCCGNPFFLAEIVRDCLAAPAVLSEPLLPQSVASSIDARVAGVSAEAQSMAAIAAVVGRAFTVEVIAAAAGTSEAAGLRGTDELLDVRLIREANGEGERGAGDFVFTHDLVRSQLYGRIPQTLRRRLHRRIGFVLEKLHAQERDALAIELARHFDEGMEAEKAAAAYLTSARQALRLYADGEALRALSRAVELTADADLRYGALSLREDIYGRAGRRAEQLADLETLEALADTSPQEIRRLDVMRRRILYARAIDDVPQQQHWIDALRDRITPVEQSAWVAFCSEASAALMMALGRYDEALASAREAALTYKDLADDAGVVRSLCRIADISTLRDDSATALVALDEATAIAVASSNEASIVRALAASALSAYMSADYEAARIPAERGLAICRAIGDREGEADFLFRLGNIAGRRFAVAAAVSAYASATEIYEALGKPLGQAIVLLNTGLLYLKIGEDVQALGALKRARSVFAEVNDLRGLTVCALNLGMAAYLRGRYGAALRLSQKAVTLAHRLGSAQLECSALSNVGAAERELGQREPSVAHSEAALEQRRRIAPMDIGSDLADMSLTYLRAGDVRRACAIAEEIEALPAPALESVMFPQNVLWSAAQTYAAAQLAEPYGRALKRAVATYEERCAKIPEGPWRDSYRRLSFNRQICEAQIHSDALRTREGVRSGA